MIRQVMKAGGIVLMLLSLVGCLQVDSVIKVKSDGSGTIEETVMMSKEMVQMMNGMMQQMMEGMTEGMEETGKEPSAKQPEQKQAMESFNLFDEAKLKQEAGDMGEGVTYVTGKAISTDTFEGYNVVYAFVDINKLKFNQNPSDNVPSDPSQSGSEEEEEYITFHFTKGKPATLSVKLPEEDREKKDDAAKPAETPEQSAAEQEQAAMVLAQMKSMFKGMKIVMAIEVEGAVVETNATHVDGSRITLFMKDLPGIKAEMNKEVTIRFK
ncbi:MAG: hypothetical protein JRJ47_13985 [Deltaproteobacteria bacterium]|nr:hypothetical protein [Deltaproteobacteria bacterium]